MFMCCKWKHSLHSMKKSKSHKLRSGCFQTEIMSFSNKNNFTSSFLILIAFISFSYLIALATTSSIMLNKSGKSGCLCLVANPCIKRKTFNFPY